MKKSIDKRLHRREMLKLLGAGLMVWQLPGQCLANGRAKENPKLIWIVLRGGLDSLHTVVPAFDDDIMKQRPSLAAPLMDSLLPLDRGFGLHPDLAFLHQLYRGKQMLPVVAVASPYRSRSHFEGQDVLESGMTPAQQNNGWLARALAVYRGEGVAIARSLPISLRGEQRAKTWYPSVLPGAEGDLYQRLLQLYESDDHLSQRLQEALETQNMVGAMDSPTRRPRAQHLVKACATLLTAADGPDCAMFEMGGWDTHNNQPGRLSRQFKQLDTGIKLLREELGKTWDKTILIIATEFGRTVKNNGTKGTDHGTASALFLAGGPLRGGQVLGEWPGLATKDLYQSRDLRPTTDVRRWLSSMLQQHWQLTEAQLARIFPGVSPLDISLV